MRNNGYTTEYFIERATKLHGNKFTYEKSRYITNKTKTTLTCRIHGDFEALPGNILRPEFKCRFCGKYFNRERFIEKSRIRHGGYYNYDKVIFKNTNTDVLITCPIHGDFKQHPYGHYKLGIGCPTCANEKQKFTTDDFIAKSKKIHGDKYNYSQVTYKGSDLYVSIECNIHGVFEQKAGSHLEGVGCNGCAVLGRTKTTEDFIKEAKVIHGDVFDYSKTIYVKSKLKVIITCNTHGDFKIIPNSHLASRAGCPRCKESKGESRIRVFLENRKVEFIQEFKIEGYLYRYDFYLPKYNVLLEFHGQQHYKPIELFGGVEEFVKVVSNDKAKIKLARDSNYVLFVLKYTLLEYQDLENVLELYLDIFDKHVVHLNHGRSESDSNVT